MPLLNIRLEKASHHEQEVVKLLFEKNESLQYAIRPLKGLRWSKTMGAWYVPMRGSLQAELFTLLKGKAWIDYSALSNPAPHTEHIEAPKAIPNALPLRADLQLRLEEFRQWMFSKRYSVNTIKTYTEALRCFLAFFKDKQASDFQNRDLVVFNNDYILKNKLSSSFQNQVVNAVKLFFRTVEGRQLNPELIHRPKRQKLLPNVLSKEEVKLILLALSNIKHKAMLSLIYSCGLRRSELLNLTLRDIDSNRKVIVVRQSKGRKDRIVPLSEKILLLLREYYAAYKPKHWVFEGQNGQGQYDESSLAAVLKQAVEKSKINKPVTLHWLRHSYATHLLESGTDLRYIQEILGHSRSTITEIYTHVSNKSIQRVVSPFDSL